MSKTIKPTTFAHVVYRTHRFEEMLKWYQTVFGAKLQFKSDVIAFLAYDDEHHRVAFLNLSIIKPSDGPAPKIRDVGVDHVAYGYRSLTELLEKYAQLKEQAILPYWCIHHGITVSMYYADPDGNQMEFQVDSFGTNDEANAFMAGPHYELNPIGVEYDPEEMLRRVRAGEPEETFLPRHEHLPVAPVRGSLGLA
ncbi:MAG: VOC family protein [Variovorax sp.]